VAARATLRAVFTARARAVSPELTGVLLVQQLLLAAQLRTGWLGDDAADATLRGALEVSGQSFGSFLWSLVESTVEGGGRLFPVSIFQSFSLIYLVDDLLAYKIVLLALVALSSVAFWWLLRELGVGRSAAALVVLVASLGLQFRDFHDPVLAYRGILPLVQVEVCTALVLHLRYAQGGRAALRWLSVGIFGVSCLHYESVVLLAALFPLMTWVQGRRPRPSLTLASPQLVLSGALLLLGAWLRAGADVAANPYAPRLEPSAVLETLAHQVSAALPLSYVLLDETTLFEPRRTTVLADVGTLDVLVGLVVGAAVVSLLARASRRSGGLPTSRAVAVGLTSWVLLALPIAVATRYQAELRPGVGYLPVFNETFAMGSVVVAMGLAAVSRLRGRTAALLIAILGVGSAAVATVGHQANDVVAARLERLKDLREAIERATQDGLLDSVPSGSEVAIVPGDLYALGLNPGFFQVHAGRPFAVTAGPRAGATSPDRCGGPRATWNLIVASSGRSRHIALAACAVEAPATDKVAARATDLPRLRLTGTALDGTTVDARASELLQPTGRPGIFELRAPLLLQSVAVTDAD
jgi:hypothetical protein